VKIALVSPYDYSVPGGVGNHITQLAEQFAGAGHEVALAAPASREQPDLPFARFLRVGSPICIPAGGSIARVSVSFRQGPMVAEMIRRERFDVVHVHEPMMPVVPANFLRYSDALNIGTFHAAQEGGNRFYAATKGLLRRWFDKLDGRIAVSPAAARLVSRYFPGEYEVIPNGIDTNRFRPDVEPIAALRDGKVNILFLGRAEKRKGLRHLLNAFRQLRREVDDVRLVVVGPLSKLRLAQKEWVERKHVPDVVFTGFVPDAEVPRYYRTADIFCAPNIGSESFGLVLVEAMACGTPIVASDIEGFGGVMTHGVEGLLVKPADEDALAAALLQMIKNPQTRQEMAASCRKTAEGFGWPRISSSILSYYERARTGRGEPLAEQVLNRPGEVRV
jgi:phosphatidyl-myo-inositol alpha-mannosyltransferase